MIPVLLRVVYSDLRIATRRAHCLCEAAVAAVFRVEILRKADAQK